MKWRIRSCLRKQIKKTDIYKIGTNSDSAKCHSAVVYNIYESAPNPVQEAGRFLYMLIL